MGRREFISFVAAMAAAWPLVGTCRLTPEEFHTAYPKLRAWIQKTLEFYEKNAKPVASMRFVRQSITTNVIGQKVLARARSTHDPKRTWHGALDGFSARPRCRLL